MAVTFMSDCRVQLLMRRVVDGFIRYHKVVILSCLLMTNLYFGRNCDVMECDAM
jgi:hypothetical protein